MTNEPLPLSDHTLQAQIGHKPGFSFSLYSMVIEAAVNGMGIMMGHRQLISRELQKGSLTRIFDDTVPVKGYYYLHKNARHKDNGVVNEFQNWITHQANNTRQKQK